MEDRLSAFLFHAGVTNNKRESITRNKKVRPNLVHIFETENPSVRNIGSKLGLMKTLISWSEEYVALFTSKDYPDLLCRQLNRCARLSISQISTLTDQLPRMTTRINRVLWRWISTACFSTDPACPPSLVQFMKLVTRQCTWRWDG